MAKTEHYFTRFVHGKYYHVYNRSVDRKPMFAGNGNYDFFLGKYHEYISPVAHTCAYCLLGNHFHLLIQIRDAPEIELAVKPGITPHDMVSRQFRKFFQSYAMAFNKQQNRVGTLFQTPFKKGVH